MTQLPCIGLSWPFTNRQLLGVASHLLSPQCILYFFVFVLEGGKKFCYSLKIFLSTVMAEIHTAMLMLIKSGNWHTQVCHRNVSVMLLDHCTYE